VKPIPVSFHIGPLLVHTYGIGLAITFWFAYRYFERRLRDNGYETRWLAGMFLWVVVAAIIGARMVHVLSDLSYYSSNPGEILSVWHGGLSSFGGLLLGVPTGVLIARHRCPELGVTKGLDLVAPVLMAAWGVGRLLGPQLMFAGGGARTAAWYGMYYAGEQGRRVPVPIIQSIDSFVIFGILLLIERRYRERPRGFVMAATAALWGLGRFFEEFVFLRQSSPQGSVAVEAAGLVLFGAGVTAIALLWRRQRRKDASVNATAASPADEAERATPPTAASVGSVRPDTATNPRTA
jgi:phosphatidylglycerol:prolipoprotein diacylglycerol transferase